MGGLGAQKFGVWSLGAFVFADKRLDGSASASASASASDVVGELAGKSSAKPFYYSPWEVATHNVGSHDELTNGKQ